MRNVIFLLCKFSNFRQKQKLSITISAILIPLVILIFNTKSIEHTPGSSGVTPPAKGGGVAPPPPVKTA